MSFIIVWKVAGLLVIPKNITRGSKRPRLVRKAAIGAEGRLLFISRLDAHIVKLPLDVKFCEVLGSAELGDEFRDEGERIPVFDSHGVQYAIVLD